MSLWLYFRTMCCLKGQIKKHRGPHKPEGGAVGWRRLKSDIPQSDTRLKHTAADREGQRAGFRGRPKHVDLSLGAWRLSGEDRKDLRAEVKRLPDLVWVHLRASWTENQPTWSCWRQPVRPIPTTTRFESCPAIYHSWVSSGQAYWRNVSENWYCCYWVLSELCRKNICSGVRCCGTLRHTEG